MVDTSIHSYKHYSCLSLSEYVEMYQLKKKANFPSLIVFCDSELNNLIGK